MNYTRATAAAVYEYKYIARTLYTLRVQRAACGYLKVAITLKVKFERSVRSRERSGLSRPPSFCRKDRTNRIPWRPRDYFLRRS